MPVRPNPCIRGCPSQKSLARTLCALCKQFNLDVLCHRFLNSFNPFFFSLIGLLCTGLSTLETRKIKSKSKKNFFSSKEFKIFYEIDEKKLWLGSIGCARDI